MQILYKFPEYYKCIIDHLVNTELEVNLLDEIFKRYHVKTILDVACGIGRHAIPLAKKGYVVTGIDYSPFQIKKARNDAKNEGVKVEFILQDANTFLYPDRFNAAICMWTTLGEEPLQYRKVIRNVFQSLKKGGIFIIDNKSWEHIPQEKEKNIENTVTADDGAVIKTRIHDRYTENFRIRDVIHEINGKEYKDLCVTHLLKEKDWINELEEVGFDKLKIYHDYKTEQIKKPRHINIVAIK